MEHELHAWHAIDKLRSIIESRLVVGAILDRSGDKLVALHEELDRYTADPNVFFKIKTIYHTTDVLTLVDKRGYWDFDLQYVTASDSSNMFLFQSPVATYIESRIPKQPGWFFNDENISIELKGPNWTRKFQYLFVIERNRNMLQFDEPFELCLRLKDGIVAIDTVLRRFSTASELYSDDTAVLASKYKLMETMLSNIKDELSKTYYWSFFGQVERDLELRYGQLKRDAEGRHSGGGSAHDPRNHPAITPGF